MKNNKRDSVDAPLSQFMYGAREESYIEVTEWTNGEGYDIDIDDRHISLAHEELDAINYLTAHLRFNCKD